MESLRQQDLRSVLEFLQECYSVSDLDGFVSHILFDLSTLVPSEPTVYNEYNFKRNRILWQQNPSLAVAGSERIWEHYSADHPILSYIRRTKDGRAVKFSDFISQQAFHRTGLYNEFFRPLRINHQMHVLFREPRNLLAGIALNRKSRDFSERERMILNLLRPHLLQAYRNAEVLTEALQEAAALRRAIEELHRGVIWLSASRKIRFMNDTARLWMSEYFGPGEIRGNRLPRELDVWVIRQRRVVETTGTIHSAVAPFSLDRAGKALRAWLVTTSGRHLIVLEERRTTIDPLSLEFLGLTRREAEVLSWMAQGKTNAEIGTILDTRPRTVEKHIERILDKLGVETRTGAVGVALRSIEAPPR